MIDARMRKRLITSVLSLASAGSSQPGVGNWGLTRAVDVAVSVLARAIPGGRALSHG